MYPNYNFPKIPGIKSNITDIVNQAIIDTHKTIEEEYKTKITAVTLFGSYAGGKIKDGKKSDVDALYLVEDEIYILADDYTGIYDFRTMDFEADFPFSCLSYHVISKFRCEMTLLNRIKKIESCLDTDGKILHKDREGFELELSKQDYVQETRWLADAVGGTLIYGEMDTKLSDFKEKFYEACGKFINLTKGR